MIQGEIIAARPGSTYTVEGVSLTLKQAIRWVRAEQRKDAASK